MAWALGVTVQFAEWYLSLDASEQESVRYSLVLLAEAGPLLGRPHVDSLRASRHPNMKELRRNTTAGRTGYYSHSIPPAPQ
jgi:hypothetical protein